MGRRNRAEARDSIWTLVVKRRGQVEARSAEPKVKLLRNRRGGTMLQCRRSQGVAYDMRCKVQAARARNLRRYPHD
jgi:hypothetical protein